MYNGCVDGLFKARALCVLTQLPRERRWAEIWVKLPPGVLMAGWNDDGRREEVDSVCLGFKMSKTFDSQNMILVPENTTCSGHAGFASVYMA